MPINFNQEVFPINFINKFYTRLDALDNNLHVFKRRVTTKDPALSIGIFGDDFRPVQASREMMGMFPHEPVLSQYSVTIQGLVIDVDEERGLSRHYVLSNAIRATLAYDEQLRLHLSLGVTDSTNKYREELRKWSIGTQEYLGAELGSSNWAFMSVTSINLETETRRVA